MGIVLSTIYPQKHLLFRASPHHGYAHLSSLDTSAWWSPDRLPNQHVLLEGSRKKWPYDVPLRFIWYMICFLMYSYLNLYN